MSLLMRNGIFLAILVNKDVTAISDSSPPGHSGRRRIPELCGNHQAAVTPDREPWRTQDIKNCRILTPDSWDAHERNDFSEPRLLHLPIYRKALNSLSYLNFFNSQKYFWCSDYPLFVASFYITWLLTSSPPHPTLSKEQFSQGYLKMLPTKFEVLKIPTE